MKNLKLLLTTFCAGGVLVGLSIRILERF